MSGLILNMKMRIFQLGKLFRAIRYTFLYCIVATCFISKPIMAQTVGIYTNIPNSGPSNSAEDNPFGSSIAVGINARSTSPLTDGDSIAIGTDATAGNLDTLAIGGQVNASGQNSIAIGNGSKFLPGVPATSATGKASIAVGNNSLSSGVGSISIGTLTKATSVYGVALGLRSEALREGLGITGESEAFTGKGGSFYGAVSVGNEYEQRQIVNLAGGTQNTDAVNIGQLRVVANNLTSSLGGGADFDESTNLFNAPTFVVGGIKYQNTGDALAASNSLSVQYAPDASGAPTNIVDLTKAALLSPALLTGLEAAAVNANSTDAVNGAQLFETNETVSALRGSINSGTIGLIRRDLDTNDLTVGAETDGTVVNFANASGGSRNLTNIADGQIDADSKEAVNGHQIYSVSKSVANNLGGGSTVSPDGTIRSPEYSVDGTAYHNVGAAVSALDRTSVKYDYNRDTGSRESSITLQGSDPNKPVVIHNVADGSAPSDAANTGQVSQATSASFAYTDNAITTVNKAVSGVTNRVSNLESRVDELHTLANQAAAIGLAAASLRFDQTPGKLSTAVGIGFWKGQVVSAMGLGYTIPDSTARVCQVYFEPYPACLR